MGERQGRKGEVGEGRGKVGRWVSVGEEGAVVEEIKVDKGSWNGEVVEME